jgi:hypothetical protein
MQQTPTPTEPSYVAVSGPGPAGATGTSVLISRVLFNRTAAMPAAAASSMADTATDVSLPNLWAIREAPARHRGNCFMDNVDVLVRELGRLRAPCLLLDPAVGDRDVAGLLRLAERLPAHVRVACCTGPGAGQGQGQGGSAEILAEQMVVELAVGVTPVAQAIEAGAITITAVKVIPAAISFSLTNATELSGRDVVGLRACGIAQSRAPGVPVLLELCPWSRLHAGVADVLVAAGGDLGRVIMSGCVLSRETVEYFAEFLSKTANNPVEGFLCLCIDTFGAMELPTAGPMYPSDEEIISCVCQLIKMGHLDRLILSPGIRYRMDLRCGGGPGYAHLETLCDTRLRSALQRELLTGTSGFFAPEEIIDRLIKHNGMTKMAWYTPPEPAEIQEEKLTCFVCGTSFPPGDHYEKFEFVYCSSKCLGTHRAAGWKK